MWGKEGVHIVRQCLLVCAGCMQLVSAGCPLQTAASLLLLMTLPTLQDWLRGCSYAMQLGSPTWDRCVPELNCVIMSSA
jgi:hypothetical protein